MNSGDLVPDIAQAIEDGDLAAVRAICTTSPPAINARVRGYSPLMLAIRGIDREFAIIEYLVGAGADVNARTEDGYTPLHCNVDVSSPSAHGEMPFRVARLLHGRGADTEIRNPSCLTGPGA